MLSALLALTPLLLLLLPLLAGRFVGEDVLERARTSRAAAPVVHRTPQARRLPRPRILRANVPRSALLPGGIALRPPPRAAARTACP